MKIRIFTLISALAIGVVTSMAQLSWVYDNQTLADGETITVNDEAMTFTIGFTIDVYNDSDVPVECVVRRSNVQPEGSLFGMCTDNCVMADVSPAFTVNGNSKYQNIRGEGFHINNASLFENGEASATFTVSGGGYEAELNVVFVVDDNPDNNGVTIGTTGVADVTGAEEYGIVMKGNELCVTGTREGQQVRVIDLTGRVAASFVVAGDSTQRYDLNLGRGIYLVALQDGGRTVYTQKVISR